MLVVTALLTLCRSLPCVVISSFILVLVATLLSKDLSNWYMKNARKVMASSLLRAGRGLKSHEIKLLGKLLRALCIALAISLAYTIISVFAYGSSLVPLVIAVVLTICLLILLFLPKALVGYWASQRKTQIEIELPYFVIVLRVFSALKLPIYDLISLVENSVVFKQMSREIKFARKIATITKTSLLSALDSVFSQHPSEKISDYIRRLFIATATHGDVASVAEKVFDTLYSWFESKVSGLVGHFTIIVGASLFVYLFIPVIVASIMPIMGGGLFTVLGVSLLMQFLVFFVLYAMISSLYPSSLVIKPSKRLVVASTIAILVVGVVVFINVYLLLSGQRPLEQVITTPLVAASFIPSLVIAEREYRRAGAYDSLIRATSESLSLAATTGENPVSALERGALRYDRRVIRLVKTIATSYISEKLRKAIVLRAPSLFHASFVETLCNVFRLGATPEMLKTFTSSYERLATLAFRVRGFAKTLEATMVGLVAVVGGFLAYVDKVFEAIARLIESAKAGASIPLTIPFTYDSRTYQLLDNLSILSLLFLSLLIGVVRGGSFTYNARSFLIMLAIYVLSRNVVKLLGVGF